MHSFSDFALHLDKVNTHCVELEHIMVTLSDLFSIMILCDDILFMFVLNRISSGFVFKFISDAKRDPFDFSVADESKRIG